MALVACGGARRSTSPPGAAPAPQEAAFGWLVTLDQLVTSSQGPPEKGTERSRFGPQDEQVVALLRVVHLQRSHQVVFRWYAPEGTLYVESPPAELPIRHQETRPFAEVWHSLDVAGEPAASLTGTWRVVALLDGRVLGETTFLLGEEDRHVD